MGVAVVLVATDGASPEFVISLADLTPPQLDRSRVSASEIVSGVGVSAPGGFASIAVEYPAIGYAHKACRTVLVLTPFLSGKLRQPNKGVGKDGKACPDYGGAQ